MTQVQNFFEICASASPAVNTCKAPQHCLQEPATNVLICCSYTRNAAKSIDTLQCHQAESGVKKILTPDKSGPENVPRSYAKKSLLILGSADLGLQQYWGKCGDVYGRPGNNSGLGKNDYNMRTICHIYGIQLQNRASSYVNHTTLHTWPPCHSY